MKKRSHILTLLLTAMLAAEPAQMVLAETAGPVTAAGDITSGDQTQGDTAPPNQAQGNTDDSVVAPPKVEPGWIKVEKGYQWRLEDGTFLKKSGWVTLNGKKYFLIKGVRYSGWQMYKNKRRYYLSNGDRAKNRWVKNQESIITSVRTVPALQVANGLL